MARVVIGLSVVLAFAACVAMAQDTKYNDPLFTLETDGKASKLKGRSCIKVYEDRPTSYDDNYLCAVKTSDTIEQYGITYSNDHIDEKMKCVSLSIDNTDKTQGISDRVVERWADNFICTPWSSKLEIVWTEQKPVTGRFDCINFADTGFPNYYLCYRLERSIDCQVSAWSDWDSCTAGCGEGTQTRTRTIAQQPANDGQACPALVEKRPCVVRQCDEVLGFLQRMTRYVAALVVFGESLALVVLLAPLPGGYRQKFIAGSVKLWESNKNIKIAAGVVGGILAIALAHCVWVIVAVSRMAEIDTAANLDYLAFSDQAYLTGFALLILLLLVRFQRLLRHYMLKADTAASPKNGTADSAKPTKSD